MGGSNGLLLLEWDLVAFWEGVCWEGFELLDLVCGGVARNLGGGGTIKI